MTEARTRDGIALTGAVITHPRRLASARALVSAAPAGFLDLVLDPRPDGPPTGLRTSIRAWSEIPAGATHHLVLEDDAQLPAGFRARAEQAAAAAPEAALVLFTSWASRNGAVVRMGALAGARWASPVAEYTANVALILPAAVGAGFGDYARAHGATWPDDVILARYLKDAGVPTYLTIPNLVEHGEFPSLSGNDLHGLRRSACHALPAQDANWSLANLIEPTAVPFFKFGLAQHSIRYGDRWLTVGSERGSGRLGVDLGHCTTEFDATMTTMASLADRVAIRKVAVRKLAALWRTGYALGLLIGENESRVGWSDDPLVAEALSTIGPGGLCMERGAAELRDLVEPLARLATSAVLAGARQPEFTRTGRRILVTGTEGPLRTTISEDLTDRGHQIVVDSPGENADAVIELHADGPPTEVVIRCHTPATTTLRLGVPYGPEIVGGTPLNELVLQSLLKQPMRASTALPDAVRFAHVWDIAQAVALLVESPLDSPGPAGEFDICHYEVVGPRELAELIGRTIRSVRIELAATRPQLPAGPQLHTEPATRELGWRPALDLAEGIRTVAQWLAYEE